MNRERMQAMADMLAEVVAGTWQPTHRVELLKGKPKLAFDMENWAMELNGDNVLFSNVTDEEYDTCGYAACAVGHAGFDKRFIDLPLEHDAEDGHLTPANFFDTPAEYFGITRQQANYLFDPERYDVYPSTISAEIVLKRVRELIATHRGNHDDEESAS